ncbi:hypothetical protein HMPREF1139_0114 [Campylobacter sp. FOBRC14]|nr:hypothetical protein HMPREF1139_0114 [Campylobacter sp. FOBRC14]
MFSSFFLWHDYGKFELKFRLERYFFNARIRSLNQQDTSNKLCIVIMSLRKFRDIKNRFWLYNVKIGNDNVVL